MFAYSPPATIAFASALVAGLLCLEALRRARLGAGMFEHLVWAGASAFVYVGQRMTITLDSGLSLHYLGAAFLALLVGYPRAVLSMAAIFAIEATREVGWETWGLRSLLAGALPVWIIWVVTGLSRRHLPRNPFVFLLGVGLFGLLSAHTVTLGASAIAYVCLAPNLPAAFWNDLVPYALLLASGESWLEAMLTTLLVVYVPGSVRLFDEGFYLSRRA